MKFILGASLLAATVSALPSPAPPAAAAPGQPRKFTIRQDFLATANKIIPVVVGGPQDTYAPNVVTAAVGDIVQFQFSNGNHTVTQSAAEAACQPLQATVATGVHSGHIPFVDGQTEVGTFNMPVTSTDTMFLYCATGPHCQEGQVMVINPTDDQQIVDYVKASQSTTASVDGTAVVGGTVGTIPLAEAAFVPAPAEEAAPPAAAPPAAAPPAAAPAEPAAEPAEPAAPETTPPPAPADPAAPEPPTTTITITVPPV
ncbi:uncharacterized protein BCR38DRAFT_489807 [Pseudomassariella vexata]|uniref:Cupredoxin n=1 Tax=Pseudomassariella vexata TaxID=1141098 RepID=A0A1Y2DEX0_9PEZI|nr:uncharacterized protein BCR38DRAFT_489807 [Pseudomassariella vexata]ORY57811.1 hypothetical protein BCR38DRAFT_489807 [Pseudomassariella vexata]